MKIKSQYCHSSVRKIKNIFTSSRKEKIVSFSSRFAVKLICCIAFECASSTCYLLKSNAII